MLRFWSLIVSGLLVLLLSDWAQAQTPTCDKLFGTPKTLALEIMKSQHPYDCCDDTIYNCLNQKPRCSLAYRLAENICSRVLKEQNKEKIVRGLSRRARSMMPGNEAKIDLVGLPVAGIEKAPVTLVEYACARCPYCAKITPKIYDVIVNGRLKGKVRMYFKSFPIRSHEFSKETGLGFITATRLGKFWEFLLYTYEHFDNFCIKKQSDWAESAGMERGEFEQTNLDPVTRKLLVDSKKEGIVNKVDATPTFFINGRKYVGDINYSELVDTLEEEYEKVSGKRHR
jgi:Thioredoxin